MRNLMLPEIDSYRIRSPFVLMQLGDYGDHEHGMFLIPNKYKTLRFQVIASVGEGWEHVSVSIPLNKRTPTWEEMCFIKDRFWEPEDTVMQLHPRHSQYVSYHEFCLHLWRPLPAAGTIPEPPSILVGPLVK